jgi:hypothetical protein
LRAACGEAIAGSPIRCDVEDDENQVRADRRSDDRRDEGQQVGGRVEAQPGPGERTCDGGANPSVVLAYKTGVFEADTRGSGSRDQSPIP